MKFELEEKHRRKTDEELIAQLRKIAADLGKTSVSRAENEEKGKYGTTTYIRRFGSWFKALEKAGLEKTRTPMNVPEEELFLNLEEIWIKLGRQPHYSEVQKPLSKYHVGTYENRFGTWRKALEKFVAYINSEEIASSQETIKSMRSEPSSKHKTKRNVNSRLRVFILMRDHSTCKICGRSPEKDHVVLHVDHIKAWANGGETVMENLQTLCSKCNIGKSDIE